MNPQIPITRFKNCQDASVSIPPSSSLIKQTFIYWFSASGKLLLTLVKENYSKHRNEAKNNYATI